MDYIAAAAVVLAYIAKGMSGFANTLIFSSIMGFKANNIAISPVELIVGYPSNAFIAWKERASISMKICAALSALVLTGVTMGAFFLKFGDARVIKLLFGVAVILIGAEMFFSQRRPAGKKTLLSFCL